MRLPPLEPIRARWLAPHRGAVLELARELCLARCASTLRELRLHEGPADSRAERTTAKLVELGLEAGFLRSTVSGRRVPTAKLSRAAPYGEVLVEHAATTQLDVVAFRWLTRALDALPSVLVGAVLAEEALFPGNDFSLAGELYAQSTVFSFFSRVAVDVLSEADDEGRPLRVLEVGGGTGGTTRALLARQPRARCAFTDVAPFFVERAIETVVRDFEGRCTAAKLDLDADSWRIGGRFDAVVAINVLHLVKEIDRALERLRELLVPNGVLVMGEVSSPGARSVFPLMDLTFGLLPSFQRKGASPLESSASWCARLTRAGFRTLRVLPLTTADSPNAEDLGGVILAFAPGTHP